MDPFWVQKGDGVARENTRAGAVRRWAFLLPPRGAPENLAKLPPLALLARGSHSGCEALHCRCPLLPGEPRLEEQPRHELLRLVLFRDAEASGEAHARAKAWGSRERERDEGRGERGMGDVR